MRQLFTILLLSLSCLILAQGKPDSITAVIRDADTGAPIQYASVYVSPSCGTISNYDGEFCLQCLPDEVLRISCIGYRHVSVKASELPAVIRMKPIATELKELTVTRGDDILYRLVSKMQKEARNNRKAEAQYFLRMTTQYPGTDELAEAFMSAKSCVQIRDITFHSGNRGQLRESVLEGPSLTGLGRTNMHIFLRLSPVLVNYDIWDFTFVPADIILRRMKNLYELSCVKFTEEDGTEISKIKVTANPAVIASHPMLDGTLYVDRKKCRLLRFDGEIHGLQIVLYDQAREQYIVSGVQYTMHVDYRHDHGFTEIASMSGTLSKDSVTVRQLLFNIGDKNLKFSRSVRVKENMIRAIDEVGFDSVLWAMSNIVKRTQAEERVAFKDAAFRSSGKSKYNTTPTEQEKNANMYLSDAIRQLMGNTMTLQRGLPPKSQNKKKKGSSSPLIFRVRPLNSF